MGAPFTVNSPTTGQVVYMVDGQGNSVQVGNFTVRDMLIGPALGNPTSPSPGYVKVFTPDGETLSTVDAAGSTATVGFPSAFSPAVTTAPVTVTGVTAATLLAPGITIPAGALAAGQVYQFKAWGTVTTTVDTQTVHLVLRYGGVTGTALVDFGTQTPNGSATVTAVAWRAQFDIVVVSGTSITASGDDALNFFPTSVNQGLVTGLTNTAAEQLVITTANSATAVSITANGSYCVRLA